MRKYKRPNRKFLVRKKHAIARRKKRVRLGKRKKTVNRNVPMYWRTNDSWLGEQEKRGLLEVDIEGRKLVILLPASMNFSSNFDETSIVLEAIRRFTRTSLTPKTSITLGRVDFTNLRKISTSAALVLTAELSRWEDFNDRKLVSRLEEWDDRIAKQLSQLGFFDLFEMAVSPEVEAPYIPSRSLVRYIKAKCDDPDAFLDLESEIQGMIGDAVQKWMFLHLGITEAITNVSHHAYPDLLKTKDRDKNWYLTGSYDSQSQRLKIVFYDQGVGIPGSLPASKIKEQVASFVANQGLATGRKDAMLIEAAMEISRTRTGNKDQGKGLNDLVEFAKQRGNGYLSILSSYGLYKVTVDNGKVSGFRYAFDNRIMGTLIIWSTNAT